MAESTSQKKNGIRCGERKWHNTPTWPDFTLCGKLLMEERDGTVGIKCPNGHFTPMQALFDEAKANGWVPDETETDQKENDMTTTQTSHRYADQGQIDAIWAIFDKREYTHALGEFIGASTADNRIQLRGQFAGSKLYLFEQLKDRYMIRAIQLDKQGLARNADSEYSTLFELTRETIRKIQWDGRIDSDPQPVLDHEAEVLIADLQAIDEETSTWSPWV